MNKNFFTVLVVMAFCLLLINCGGKSETTDSKEAAEEANKENFDDTKVEDDADFAVAAADAGMLEVKLGELAQTNAFSADVKSFGKMMADDHSKANDELNALAKKKNIVMPLALSDKNKKRYSDLAEKTGKDFDDAYTEFMVKDHKDVIDSFKKEAEKGNDADIKAWASGKISVLEHHLDMAKRAEQAVDKSK